MANKYRAEATLYIAGQPITVALTTAAVVELAEALEIETFQDLTRRLIEFKVRDIPIVIGALLKGNGYPADADEVKRSEMNPHDYTSTINALLLPPTGGDAKPSDPQKASAKRS